MQQRAADGERHHGHGAGHRLGGERRPFQGIERDIDLGAASRSDLLADEEHGRLVALALPDHDGAVDLELVKGAPHGVDGSLVGGLFIASSGQLVGGQRRGLGDAGDLDRQRPVQQSHVAH